MINFDIKVRDAFCGQQYYSAKDFKAFERGFKQGHKDRQPEIEHLKKWGEGKENKALKDKLEEVTRELSALKEAYGIQAKALTMADNAVRALSAEGLTRTDEEYGQLTEIICSQYEALEQAGDSLKWAYCGVVGSDSIVGLDCCSDYAEWLASLPTAPKGDV